MIQEVRRMDDILRLDNKKCKVKGQYIVIPQPTRGSVLGSLNYAIVVLEDGTKVFLETFRTHKAKRAKSERIKFNRRYVNVIGIIHLRMPCISQGPLAPSISDIEIIEEVDLP